MFSRTFPTASTTACDAGRRALLSQGYNIDRFDPARVSGHKNFQGEDGLHTQINFNIDCASDGSANQRATVFANAVQDRYSIKRTSSSASVGVSVLGQVSMPFGSSDDSLVKTASQTVSRPKFYEGFFQLLQRFLPDAEAAAAPHVPSPVRARANSGKPQAAPADPAVTPDAPADTLNPALANGTPAAADKTSPAAEPNHAATPSASGNSEAGTAAPATAPATAPAATPATPSAATPAVQAPAPGATPAATPAAPASGN
ncbi:large tegument domain-containing protein [Achromobacter marplatensis]|nr:large tegument domain-containing protein [Achromobacter marplatensis]